MVSGLTIQELLKSFDRQNRNFLRDSSVAKSRHVRIDTSCGPHLTSEAVLDALKEREENLGKGGTKSKAEMEEAAAYKEPREHIRRSLELYPERPIGHNHLQDSWKESCRQCHRRTTMVAMEVLVVTASSIEEQEL
eukprot:gb/GEZJ01009985.1/.p1 GENE.gb/GEZJ01009985.1/~~gb/GEZJ01009985.1/.p1  ORF type:complete len:136 (-),score=12.47 gb/GEZJ01009985.1/:120-527(-)